MWKIRGIWIILNKINKKEISSAGGVVINSKSEIVICRRFSTDLWALPKGKIEFNETIEEAAVREVEEETGLLVEIRNFINSIEYTYYESLDNVYYNKTVFFYLMKSVGGDFINHDNEFDDVIWVPKHETSDKMTFESEVGIVKEGFLLVNEQYKAG